MQKMSASVALAALLSATIPPGPAARAAVSAQEAAQLKSSLTPLGGERAGNADGTIPAWNGGNTKVPTGYQTGAPRPDPFADEQPRLTITRANLAAHAAKLPAGAVELFKRYADFEILVYPTHRTAAAPQSVYDATLRNATTARMIENGNAIADAHGGIPFPIAKTGNEMLWNAILHWQGVTTTTRSRIYIITPDGQKALASTTDGVFQYPYYQDDPGPFAGAFQTVATKNIAPAFAYGQAVLAYNMLNPIKDGQPGWQYLVGQRRVRKAPNLQYDTPDFIASGMLNFDEINGFSGAMDRYTWKALGKQELYIPYNTNKLTQLGADAQLGPHFLNPKEVRWELHRVWKIEGNLAQGARHVVPRRVLYLDEDSWLILAEDEYDASGGLWKCQISTPFLAPEVPALASYTASAIYDFHNGSYLPGIFTSDEAFNFKQTEPYPADYFTPDGLAARGTR